MGVLKTRDYPDTNKLLAITDGDTLLIDWDLGAKMRVYGEDIRLNGLDAPESSTTAGKAALAYVTGWFFEHCPQGMFTLRTIKVNKKRLAMLPMDKQEKFGRYLGIIIAADGHCLNEDLIATGNAKPWKGQGPKPWS
jgi:endonuclease YncB( thermonuclease family)